MKLLFIEDDPAFFSWLKVHLDGHICRRAGTIEEAEQILSKEDFDACFVDLGMPRCTPVEVVARARSANSRTPLIILTGMEMRSDLASICDGFLFKGGLDEPAQQIPHAVQSFSKLRLLKHPLDIAGQLFSALHSLRRASA